MVFETRTDTVGDWTVVRVVGDMDLAGLPAVRSELERVVGPKVALDLTGVDYVDPVALGVAVAGSVRMSRRGGAFSVVCPPGGPRDLMAESGLDRILTIVDRVADLRSG